MDYVSPYRILGFEEQCGITSGPTEVNCQQLTGDGLYGRPVRSSRKFTKAAVQSQAGLLLPQHQKHGLRIS